MKRLSATGSSQFLFMETCSNFGVDIERIISPAHPSGEEAFACGAWTGTPPCHGDAG
ncbi:hypothetical protein [Phreatobacter sp.]|uniref:hypothetical protein n=1 Tax=Phreatobacter sp. TaxID=1966341 RepID=UPI003F713084